MRKEAKEIFEKAKEEVERMILGEGKYKTFKSKIEAELEET